MANIEERLAQLEDAIYQTERVINKEKMPGTDDTTAEAPKTGSETKFSYIYLVAGLIPLIVGAGLYLAKPAFVMKKVKGKKVVCVQSVLKWTAMVTIVLWAGLYGLYYFGLLNFMK